MLISCLELWQHPFLCPLQIIVLSVPNVFAKGICPAPSFLNSVASLAHSSADSFKHTSCLSSAPKPSSPSLLSTCPSGLRGLLLPPMLPVSPAGTSCFPNGSCGFSADLTRPVNVGKTTLLLSSRSFRQSTLSLACFQRPWGCQRAEAGWLLRLPFLALHTGVCIHQFSAGFGAMRSSRSRRFTIRVHVERGPSLVQPAAWRSFRPR